MSPMGLNRQQLGLTLSQLDDSAEEAHSGAARKEGVETMMEAERRLEGPRAGNANGHNQTLR